MNIHLVHPKVQWSLSDVFDGLAYGLQQHGATLRPTMDGCDWVVVVNGNLHAPEALAAWRRDYAPVAVLCTETPYDLDLELERAAVVDGVWTHERASVKDFAAVTRAAFLPHAWHPERHGLWEPDPSTPAHDVVFVGSGFTERVEWFNRVNWGGIDLGLYGIWDGFGLEDELMERCCKGWIVPNEQAVKLYRRAKVNLNLYRTKPGIRKAIPRPDVHAESLNPRAYEFAACGAFHLSTARPEVSEVFGDLVPVISGKAADAKADEAIIREWLARDADRATIGAQLPAKVAHDSWAERAGHVLCDLATWSTVTV